MGLGGDHHQWEPQVAALSQVPDVQVVVYDNRGIGLSHPTAGLWTVADMAKDALALLDGIHWTAPRSVHVAGVSMGGMITLELARIDLPRFASLSLIATSAGGLSALALFVLRMPSGVAQLARTFAAVNPRDRLNHAMRLLFPQQVLDGTADGPSIGELKRAMVRRGQAAAASGARPNPALSVVARQALAVSAHRVSGAALEAMRQHFGGAVLVVTGDADELVDRRNSDILGRALGTRPVVIAQAGHGVAEQCAKQVNEALLRVMGLAAAKL
eukprot:TRINITY_DN12059_c0_g2_i2.p1 TRINITY_DN12059_c0_g2~~TRINITY_DN12059_c0_g2_i2.p1  ORF type:complete len:272 (+),score=88.86 TRINITY_DN12059_c0_g2_i2:570-1385(+)